MVVCVIAVNGSSCKASTALVERRAQGAADSDPFLDGWDTPAKHFTTTALKFGQTIAERLQHYLTILKQAQPKLSINPKSYGMHSLRRRGVVVALESGKAIWWHWLRMGAGEAGQLRLTWTSLV